MELQKLIQVLDAPKIYGDTSVEIKNIQSDSRQVEAGSLFVAVCGTTVDGHAIFQMRLRRELWRLCVGKFPEMWRRWVARLLLLRIQQRHWDFCSHNGMTILRIS